MELFAKLGSEVDYLTGYLGCLRRLTAIAKDKSATFPVLIESFAKRHGDRPALISDRESFTYAEYDARANRYARWARSVGIGKGSSVALLMPNRPEYLAIWLGIARAGGVTALLNTNLAEAGLAHSVKAAGASHAIVAGELLAAWRSAEPHLESPVQLWQHGGGENTARLDREVEAFSGDALGPGERVPLTHEDRCLFIYTSGTTGLPKAANINHWRLQAIMHGFAAAMKATERDRCYVCLPLYHSSGGVWAVGSALTTGGSAVIAERFSSERFWRDVVDRDCTTFAYVGELCRYLLNSPENPKERQHRLRLVAGNGLRPDIWTAFQTRFRIPRILEFYGATEGNAILFNFDGRAGSVGRIPAWAKKKFLLKLVRLDPETGDPLRGPDGFCRLCEPDEIGEMISEVINDPNKPTQRFEGYVDRGATERKVIRDVLKPGDAYFRTGDLLRRDRDGYYYFVDRMGDTFRWKGENVSTLEVAETLTRVTGVREANVYGVKVGALEGRAGMATLVVDPSFDLSDLRRRCHAELPAYARPLFYRLLDTMRVTGTFKHQKAELVAEGFNPAVVSDPLWFDDPSTGALVPLDEACFRRIQEGSVRL